MEKKLKTLFLISLFVFFPVIVFSQEKKIDEFEMTTYYLVFLKKGPNRTQDSTTAARIQREHLNHLDNMYKEGKMCMAGPLLDQHEIKGICIYNTKTREEATSLANADPAVISGRLIVEIHDWYSAKGMKLP